MNKIYKIIWSKVKKCYVVASELAKSHTKSPKSGVMSRALVAGVLACVLSCGAVMPAYAAGDATKINANNSAAVTGADVYAYLQNNSLLLEQASFASVWNSIAIGKQANAYLGYSVAIGYDTQAGKSTNDQYNIYGSTAVGFGSKAYNYYSLALGGGVAGGPDITDGKQIAIGYNSSAQQLGSLSLGINATALNRYGIAIGYDSKAYGNSSVAINGIAGRTSTDSTDTPTVQNVSIGSCSIAASSYSTSLGYQSKAYGSYGISIGGGLTGKPSSDSTVTPTVRDIAIGTTSKAYGSSSVAIGSSVVASGENSLALGSNSNAYGKNSVALGGGVAGNTTNSIPANPTNNNIAIGYNSRASAQESIAIGPGANSSAKNAVAIGASTSATEENTVSVGSRRIVDVANGTASNNAATYGQLKPAIKSLSVSGKVITYTKIDGTTGTITTQDTDTTYNNMTVSELETGTETTARSISAKTIADYVTGKVSTETTARTTAVSDEATARTDADTALGIRIDNAITAYESADTGLSNRIGSLSADGNYIKKSATNNVSANLSALDTQVKANAEGIENITGQVGSLDALAVKYDSTDKGKVTLAGTGGTVISNVKAGTLSADSMEAVNGSQLYTTNQNLVAETAARTDADTTLSNRIGTLSEDGTVIHKDDSVSKNLKALDESLAGIRMSGVVYDDTAHTAVTLGDGTTAVKLDNVADGTLSADSREAVNGSQLYTTNQNLATEITERITAVTNEAAAREAADTALSDRITALSGNAVQYDSEQKDNITLAGVEGTIIGNLKAGSLSEDSMEAVNGSQLYTTNQNLLAEKIAREEADAVLGERIGTVAEDGAYIKKSSTNNIAANLSALDVQMKASTDDILGLKDLSNITDSGKTVIRDLAKGTVKVASGNFTNVVKGTDGNADSYTVNVVADGQAAQGNGGLMTGGAVYTAVKDAVDTVSSANISTENLAKWAEKLGTGTVAQDSSGLISGKTLYNEVHVADGNVIRATNTVGQNLSALDAGLKIVGTDVAGIKANAIQYDDASKTAITLGNGTNVTTIRNVAAGELSSASKDAVNGGQLYSVRDKLQKADGIDKGKWQEVLGDGQVELDNTGLVTGDTVYKAIKATAATVSVRMIGINSNDKNDVNYSGGGAVGKDAVAVGSGVEAKGDNAVAMGKDSKAEGVQSVAIGHGSQALGLQSVVIGTSNKVTGNHSGAFGDPNYVTGDNSYAFGNNNSVSGSNTFVLGNNVKASGKNSVVLGAGSDGSEDNVVSVGAKGNERRITHVADGQTMTDAATVGQLSRLAQAADDGLRYLDRRVNKAGAGAAALAALHPLDMDGKFGMAAGYGNYHSTHAMALGLFYQPKDNVMFSIGGTIGNGDNMINAGVSIALDKGFTNSKAAMARNIRNLTAENAAMKEKLEAQGNEIKELKEMLMQLKSQMQKQ